MHKFYDINGIDMPSLVDEIVSNETVTLKVDELDAKNSWSRQASDKTFKEVMEIAKNDPNAHWVFINRKHFDMGFGEPNKLETGVATRAEDGKTYFIFVYGAESLVQKYAEKYKIITK